MPVIISGMAVMLITGCGGAPGAGETPGQATARQATPVPAQQGRLNEIAEAITAAGARRFPDSFAGVAVDTERGVVLVWRKASPAFDRYLSSQQWHSSVRVIGAKYAHAELEASFIRLRSDHEQWKSRGIVLMEMSIRVDGSCVEVGAQEPAKAQAALAGHYPGAELCVVQGQGRVPLARQSS